MDISTVPNDIVGYILTYAITKFFDLIIFSQISRKFYGIVDTHFEKIFTNVVNNEKDHETLRIILQCLSPHLLTGHYYLLVCKLFCEDNCLNDQDKYRINHTYAIPTIQYLYAIKNYPKIMIVTEPIMLTIVRRSYFYKNESIENKICKKISEYFSSTSDQFCSNIKSTDMSETINMISFDPNRQLFLNTAFVKACIMYANYENLGVPMPVNILPNILKLLLAGADIGAGFNAQGDPITNGYFKVLCDVLSMLFKDEHLIIDIDKIDQKIIHALGCLFRSDRKYYNNLIKKSYVQPLINKINIGCELFKIAPRELFVIHNDFF